MGEWSSGSRCVPKASRTLRPISGVVDAQPLTISNLIHNPFLYRCVVRNGICINSRRAFFEYSEPLCCGSSKKTEQPRLMSQIVFAATCIL